MKRIFVLLLALLLLLTACGTAKDDGLWLMRDGKKTTVATLTVPEGFAPKTDISLNGGGCELYFAPKDTSDPVYFFFYTAGTGDPGTLGATALKAYASFYDDYTPSELRTETLSGTECLVFDYTCSFPGEDESTTVYEHAGTCYMPLQAGGFVAVIVSLRADSAETLPDSAAWLGCMETAVQAVKLK